MKSLSLKLAILLFTPLFLTGCPDPFKSESKAGPYIRRVKGDPYVFVKGTAMNRKNSIPAKLLAKDREWKLDFGGYQEELAALPQQNIESGNEAPEKQGADAEAALNSGQTTITVQHEGNTVTYEMSNFKLTFKTDAENASLESIFDKQDNKLYRTDHELEVLHTSLKNDSSAFSILIGSQEKGARAVVQFVFVPNGPAKKEMFTTDNFYYLLGKGVKLIWPESEKTITICSSPSPGITRMFKESVAEWMKHLKGRFTIKAAESSTCPPWSDLNTQTLTILDDWIEIQGSQGYLGITVPLYDMANGRFMDSDIFLFRGELEEDAQLKGVNIDVRKQGSEHDYRLKGFYSDTILHELGHWLGLHHNFDEWVPSAMGYDPKITTLQTYDIQAIQALYPSKPTDRP